MDILISIFFIIIGFVLLIKGADILVDGSSNIAKKFHIPEIVIGLTIVSVGTSLPELLVSLNSRLKGYVDMSIGNVVGSSICNLLLILGLSATISSLTLKKETIYVEIPICFFLTIIFGIIGNTGGIIDRKEAIILLILFLAFILYTIFMGIKGEKFDEENNEEITKNDSSENDKIESVFKSIIKIVIGIVGLKFGGDFIVDHATNIAEIFGISEKIISLTIIAIGTSLPELVTSVVAAIKGKSDISIGNILGSNIFNMSFIIGTTALIKPITYNIAYNMDLLVLLIASFVLFLFQFIPPKNKMSRANGIIYLLLYGAYMTKLFIG